MRTLIVAVLFMSIADAAAFHCLSPSDAIPRRHPHSLEQCSFKFPRPLGAHANAAASFRRAAPSLIGLSMQTGTGVVPRQAASLILKEVKTHEGVDVDIKLEGLGGNRRRISGGLLIEAPPRAIWDTLTNYNKLNEYIPNIAESGAMLQPDGKIRIEQVGVISPTLNLKTRIVLEVDEEPYRMLTFNKVESREFLEFQGTYSISEPTSEGGLTYLQYSVEALPHPLLPVGLVQGKIRAEVPPMLSAVRTNANRYQAMRVSSLGEDWDEDVPPPMSGFSRQKYGKNALSDGAKASPSSQGDPGRGRMMSIGGVKPGSRQASVGARVLAAGGGAEADASVAEAGEKRSVSLKQGGLGGDELRGGGGGGAPGEGPSTPFAAIASGLLRGTVGLMKMMRVDGKDK